MNKKIKTGKTGDCTWTLNGTKLTIFGNGRMKKYSIVNSRPTTPWGNKITKVIISNGVTSIGEFAFFCCRGLTSITIPNSVTNIGKAAFDACTGLTSVTMPDSIINIGDYAFWGCHRLTSITIPDSVTSIGKHAFSCCTGLKRVTVSNGVTSIGDTTFSFCTKLKSVTMPDSITSIGEDAFFGCEKLRHITMSKNIMYIGQFAFANTLLQSKIFKYKAFHNIDDKLQCRNLTFDKNKWSPRINDVKLCNRGYHYCNNLFDIFNYYYGNIDTDISIYQVSARGISSQEQGDSKRVCSSIRPNKKLTREEIIKLLTV